MSVLELVLRAFGGVLLGLAMIARLVLNAVVVASDLAQLQDCSTTTGKSMDGE